MNNYVTHLNDEEETKCVIDNTYQLQDSNAMGDFSHYSA